MAAATAVEDMDQVAAVKRSTRYCGQPGCGPTALLAGWLRGGHDVPSWPQLVGKRVVSTHSGRAAIAFTARAWCLGSGDEVLVPAYNCGSEIDPIIQLGLRVVPYRVNEDATIDVSDVARRVTTRTRAILVIHYFGWAQDLAPLIALCRKRGLYLIEDCAHALFSASNGAWLGTTGDAAVYSYAKTLGVPHGGAVVLHNTEHAAAVRLQPARLRQVMWECLPLVKRSFLRQLDRTLIGPRAVRAFGKSFRDSRSVRRTRSGLPDIPESYYFDVDDGWREASRLTRGVLSVVDPAHIVCVRRSNYRRLALALRNVDGVRLLFPELPEGTCPLYLPVFVEQRERWIEALLTLGVFAIAWWSGYHRGIDWGPFPEAAKLKNRIVALPIHQDLGDTHIDFIAETVRIVATEVRATQGPRMQPAEQYRPDSFCPAPLGRNSYLQ